MPAAAKPANEYSRLAVLEALGILDTAPEEDFDDIVAIAAAICDVPVATITLVDSQRQWFKARVGVDAAETPRDIAFCAHAILTPDSPLVVPDAAADARFSDNPLVTGEGYRFYAGVPLIADGMPVGTVCVLDFKSRELSDRQLAALEALSRQTSRLIELRSAGRLLNLQWRERDWYERQVARHQRVLASLADDGPDDVLAGLAGEEVLVAAIAESQAAGVPLSLALVDLDGLGEIERLHGADERYRLLRDLAESLRRGRGMQGRLARAGNAFAMLLEMPQVQATAQCQRMVELVGGSADGLPVTISIGLAAAVAHLKPVQVIERARDALEQARAQGGGRVVVDASRD